MCGLVGICGPGIQHIDLSILDDLSHIIALRGTDGAGIVQGKVPYYSNSKNKEVIDNLILEKDRWDISYFKQKHQWTKEGNKNLFNGIHNNFFAVHVRAATIGEINKQNSHPFDVGDYIGMHNGTLKDMEYFRKGVTDSEMMFKDVNERGLKAVLQSLHKDSAYAIVLLDKTTGEISFTRNDKRTLYFCFHATRSVLYWASEDWMLRGVLGRRSEKIKDDQIWYFSPGVIYTIDPARLPKNTEGMDRENIFEKKEEKPRVRVQSPTQVVSLVTKREEVKKKREEKNKELQTALLVNQGLDIPGAVPGLYCCGCQKPMSLVQQYFAARGTLGKKYSNNAILCDGCDTQTKHILLN